jgi:hypothetical protein
MLNTLQTLNMQQNAPEGQKTFIFKLLNKSLLYAMAPSLKEKFQMARAKFGKVMRRGFWHPPRSLGWYSKQWGKLYLGMKNAGKVG